MTLVAFSGFGTLSPAGLRCGLPGHVGCVGGLFGAAAPSANASQEQWFNVTLYDYGFWIINSVDWTNETRAWYLFEGWTVHINATSLRADRSVGGTAYHGLGIELNATGKQLLNIAAPVGRWVTATFTVPTHAYYKQHIWCTVECGPGHSGQQMYNVYIVPAVATPSASVSANITSGHVPLVVGFSAVVSGGTPPYAVNWSFGDGSSENGSAATTHTYGLAGNYSAAFTAVDAKGGTVTRTVAVHVAAGSPLNVSVMAAPGTGVAPMLVALSSAVSGGVGPYSYAWQLGDNSSASGPTVSHLYSAVGEFGVELSVTDATGSISVATTSVAVRPPAGHFSVGISTTPLNGTVPLNVTFTGTTAGGTGPYTDLWLFGDGTSATGDPVTHQYRERGAYQVWLMTTDSRQNVGVNLTSLSVTGGGTYPLSAVLTELPSAGGPPLATTGTISVTGGSGSYGTAAWTFGDGTTGAGPVERHLYSSLGSYAMTASLTDSAGSTASASTGIRVTGLQLSVGAAPRAGDSPLTVHAFATLEGGSGTYGPVSWQWGDGAVSSGVVVNHTYPLTATGTIVIRVSATDSSGTVANASTSVVIAGGPTAVLTETLPPVGVFPATVTFSLQVGGGSGGFLRDPLWTFGDGGTTRGPSPQSHAYARPGDFRVTVVTNDSSGRIVTALAWANLSAGALAATGGQGNVWVFSGVADPNQVALALIGMMALTGLALLYRTRHDPPPRAAPRPSRVPAARDPGSTAPGPGSR